MSHDEVRSSEMNEKGVECGTVKKPNHILHQNRTRTTIHGTTKCCNKENSGGNKCCMLGNCGGNFEAKPSAGYDETELRKVRQIKEGGHEIIKC